MLKRFDGTDNVWMVQLLQNDADVSSIDRWAQLPLVQAEIREHEDVVEYLTRVEKANAHKA